MHQTQRLSAGQGPDDTAEPSPVLRQGGRGEEREGGACEVSGAVGTGTSGVHSGRGRECRGAKSVRAQEPNLLFTDKQAPRVPALPSAPQRIPIGAHLKPQASDPAGGDDPPGPARDRLSAPVCPTPLGEEPKWPRIGEKPQPDGHTQLCPVSPALPGRAQPGAEAAQGRGVP